MAENSKIEWTDHTFNPWIGCTKVSAACDNCYAEAWEARFGKSWGPHVRRRTSPANWRKPLAWDRAAAASGKRTRVFCASLADVFDNDRSITSGWRGDLWHLIYRTPHLDWLLLTKRPQNIARYLRPEEYGNLPPWGDGWPNVWLGTTVENQTEADRRIPHLLATPAAVRFVSAEPLLGPVDMSRIPHHKIAPNITIAQNALTGLNGNGDYGPSLDWIIVGGESGRGARPMHPDWARSLRDQCQAAGVAFLFKQWGEHKYLGTEEDGMLSLRGVLSDRWQEIDGARYLRVGKTAAGRTLDGRTWDEFPRAGEAE